MIAVCRGYGGDGIACRFFSFLVSGGRGDGVSSCPVPRSLRLPCGSVSFVLVSCFSSCLIVSCWRSVLRLVSVSCFSHRFVFRVGVGVLFLVSFLVSCRRSVLSGVLCWCCPVVPFLSARFPVLSRLVLSLLLLCSCSSRRACRMVSGCRECCGVVWRGRRGAGGVVWRCDVRGVAVGGSVMPCRVNVVCVAGWGGGTMSAPFLSARFGRSHIAIVRRGFFGEFSAFFTVGKYST